MTPALSAHIRERIDAVTDADPRAQTALETFYSATGAVEVLVPAELFQRLELAFLEVYDAIREGAWADGYGCGRNPDKLVFAVEPMPEPIAVDWREVAPGVAIGVTAAAAVDAWLVAGGAE